MSTAKIVLDHAALRALDRAAVRALELTGEALHKDIVQAQVVPRDTGHLQNDLFFVDTSRSNQGVVELAFEGPYARRQYYHPEYDFSKDENPNARGLWFEPWEAGGEREDFAREKFAKLYKREAGL